MARDNLNTSDTTQPYYDNELIGPYIKYHNPTNKCTIALIIGLWLLAAAIFHLTCQLIIPDNPMIIHSLIRIPKSSESDEITSPGHRRPSMPINTDTPAPEPRPEPEPPPRPSEDELDPPHRIPNDPGPNTDPE